MGQSVARELQGAGARLAMTYLLDAGEVVPEARAYALDVADEASVCALLPAVAQDIGEVQGLVNMVSVFHPDAADISYATMQQNFLINAFGNMLLARLFAERAAARGAKNLPIVSFIDWAIDHPYKGYDVYMAAKAALRHYLMALQTSFAGTIRVVNIHPGLILAPPDMTAAHQESIQRNTPTQTIGSPEQAAALVRTALELDFLADNIYLAGGQQWRHRL